VDAQGRPLHSWRTLILPYLEQEPLYRTIDLSKPWNDPANARALGTEVHAFRCPNATGPGNTTSYLGIVGPENFWVRGKSRRLAEITDGTSATLMVIEADDEHAVPWMAPTDAEESVFLRFGPDTKLHHPGGMNAGFVDGSVHFLKAAIPAQVRRALITVSGGESLNSDQW
jgi:prepilin-type processing-associated H-X9-DG protein